MDKKYFAEYLAQEGLSEKALIKVVADEIYDWTGHSKKIIKEVVNDYKDDILNLYSKLYLKSIRENEYFDVYEELAYVIDRLNLVLEVENELMM